MDLSTIAKTEMPLKASAEKTNILVDSTKNDLTDKNETQAVMLAVRKSEQFTSFSEM
ncbi:MAG: hypothetical protein PHW07_09470 [Sulfurospirillaceae bacterium]|nr:hypothetical protein [Sulfurospirillaceae bacterium]